MTHRTAFFMLLMLSVTLANPQRARSGSEWSRFRGPNGVGVTDSRGLPATFGPKKNIVWKTPLPMGKSSPVLTEEHIFLTAHEDGKLLTFCLDRQSGAIQWRRVAPGRRLEKMHRLNDEASSSPVTDGENVYVFFGGYGLLSYGPDGEERWRRSMGPFTNFHGMGASPILVDDKLIMLVDQDQQAYLLALNKDDGSVVWKTDRPEMVHSFSTPVVYRPQDGPAELVVPGSYQMVGYAVETGERLWWVRGLTYQVKSVPVLENDVAYFNGWAPGGEPSVRLVLPEFPNMLATYDGDKDGKLSKQEVPEDWHPGNWAMQDLDKDGLLDARDWRYYRARRTSSNSTLAVRLGGRGDVTETHVLWRHRKSLPDVPSVLLYRGLLYAVKNGGIVTITDPRSGEVVRQFRLRDAVDEYYASPVAADGKIYMISRSGKATVLEAGESPNILAVNALGEEVFATPAIEDGRLYIRTNSALYAFGRKD